MVNYLFQTTTNLKLCSEGRFYLREVSLPHISLLQPPPSPGRPSSRVGIGEAGWRGTEGEHGKLELKAHWWNHRRQLGVAPAQRQVAGFLYRLIMRNGEIRGCSYDTA